MCARIFKRKSVNKNWSSGFKVKNVSKQNAIYLDCHVYTGIQRSYKYNNCLFVTQLLVTVHLHKHRKTVSTMIPISKIFKNLFYIFRLFNQHFSIFAFLSYSQNINISISSLVYTLLICTYVFHSIYCSILCVNYNLQLLNKSTAKLSWLFSPLCKVTLIEV